MTPNESALLYELTGYRDTIPCPPPSIDPIYEWKQFLCQARDACARLACESRNTWLSNQFVERYEIHTGRLELLRSSKLY